MRAEFLPDGQRDINVRMVPSRSKAQVLPAPNRGMDAPSPRSAKRAAYLRFVVALHALDEHWASVFSDSDIFDMHYAKLFTRLWVTQGKPISRSEAYNWMTELSSQTAMKYVNRALSAGFLAEVENPDDRRSKLLVMTPTLSARVEALFDFALEEFRRAL